MKKLAYLAGALFGLLGLGVLALYLYLTPERLRAIVQPRLSEAIDRRVDMRAVGLSLRNGIAASVDGLDIAERQGFGDRPFVSAERAAIRLTLASIFRGSPEVGAVEIVSPHVSIVINEAGEANYGDLLVADKQDAPPGSGTAALPVDRLSIRDGEVVYEDLRDGSRLSAAGLDYALQGGLEDGRIRLRGELTVARVERLERGAPPVSAGPLKARHVLLVGGPATEIRELVVGAGLLELRVTGNIAQEGSATGVDLRVTGESVDIAGLSAVLPEGMSVAGRADADLHVSGSFGSASGPPALPGITGTLRLRDGRVLHPELAQPLDSVSVDLSIEKDQLAVNGASFRAGKSDLRVTGTLTGVLQRLLLEKGYARPRMALSLQSRFLDADALFPPVPSGSASSDASWALFPSAWAAPSAADETSAIVPVVRHADGTADLSCGELVSDSTHVRDFSGKAVAMGGILHLDDLRGEVYGGRLSGRVALDARPESGPLPLSADLAVENVEANGLVRERLGWDLPVFGRLGLSLSMKGAVDSTLVVVEKLIDATGQLAMEEGEVVNWSWLRNAAIGVSQLGFMDFDRIPLRALTAPFRVKDERLFIDGLAVRAADMACSLSGSAGFDGSLDYAADIDVPAQRLNLAGIDLGSVLGGLFKTNDAVIPLRLRITGTAQRPGLTVDLQQAGKQEIQTRKDETKQKLQEEARKGFRKLLGR